MNRPAWAVRVPTTLHEGRRVLAPMILRGPAPSSEAMIDCYVEPDYQGSVYVWTDWTLSVRGWRHVFRGGGE